MSRHKLLLYGWAALLLAGATVAYFYVKISSTPVFSVVSAKQNESGVVELESQKGWFGSNLSKDGNELYPATETMYVLDMGEAPEEGKELYYVLSIAKLDENRFKIVEKKLNDLKVLYSVKKDGSAFSVNVSLKDKESMQKLVNELKSSF